ncbi:MAG TPA: DEAD/DEAH box helicase [Edaphocola sp.]|nr:DEAD/DEAH box helicase [Edaphocola sp.]
MKHLNASKTKKQTTVMKQTESVTTENLETVSKQHRMKTTTKQSKTVKKAPALTKVTPENSEIEKVLQWVEDATNNTPLVVCGEAGTGKSTLMQRIGSIYKAQRKYFAMVAPTGVAAYNLGVDAKTIHSFFSLPPTTEVLHSPSNLQSVARGYKLRQRLEKLELLIIDEISMVRADLLDAIDFILRDVLDESLPFGGLKVLLVGDVYQLPPILQYHERKVFLEKYTSEFFFHSKVVMNAWQNNPPFLLVELLKNYRQEEGEFIQFLKRVRINDMDELDLDYINERVTPLHTLDSEKFELLIAARKDAAQKYNDKMLSDIDATLITHEAKIVNISRSFPKNMYPTDVTLKFKVGSQIMFVCNDEGKRWVNGTLGKILSVVKKGMLEVLTDRGEVVEVEVHRFEDTGIIDGKVVTMATFSQYPFQLAWAITIHKCQGLTFDNINIDFCEGAFSCGMVYVALSRCRTFEGIKLVKRIFEEDIKVSSSLKNFKKYFKEL